jgi:VWFA-related protein
VTAILLDGLNTRWEDQAYARRQVINFLSQLRPGDRIALYTLGRELRVLHDFSSDTDSLVQAISRYKARINQEVADSDPALSETGDAELDALMDELNARVAEHVTVNRVRTTLEALKAISEHLARIPGRKNLIWVSGGFPASMGLDSPRENADRRTFFDDIEDAGRSLNNSSLAVYPVDARGLVGMPDFGADRRTARNAEANRALRSLQRDHETMQIVAERTGGRAFYNSNDIQGAIRRAIDDSRVTYTLGYHPSHGTWDGSFREIKVKLRRSGLTASYRRGYHAYPDKPVDARDRRAALREALWSPLEATAIGLTVHARPEDKPKPNLLRIFLGIDPRNINLEQKDGRWSGRLDLLFVQSGQGSKSQAMQDSVDLKLEPASYRKVVEKGFVFTKAVERVQGATELRVVVRDVTTGSVGSVTIPLAEVKKGV